MKRIVITGGLGFIGTNFIQYLLELKKGVCIRVVDDLSQGEEGAYDTKLQIDELGELWQAGVTFVEGATSNVLLADKVCEGADAVVHLAANTGVIPSIENPRFDCQINVLGAFNYLDACRKNSVPRFVLASSSAVLGDQSFPFFEEMCPHPISPYGASKLCGEAYCSAFNRSYDIQTVCLRFSNVFGPHSMHKDSVVAKFIKQILLGEELVIYGDGGQIRDFIYVQDVCEAIWCSLTKADVGGEVFQIGSGCSYFIAELVGNLEQLSLMQFGRPVFKRYESVRVGEVLKSISNVSKAEKVLGWKSKWEFATALERTFLWFARRVGSL